uniref:Uncharacterized protein n=3 Tax=Aegilops tauschii subsp. strangulata TaxID=200361 RepID=A0A453QZG0_AEGTS
IQFSSSITRVRRWWLRPARRTRSAQDRRPAAAANSFSPLRRLAHRANPARRPRSAQGGRPATGADNSSAAFSPLRRLALRANTPLSIPHRIGIGSRSEGIKISITLFAIAWSNITRLLTELVCQSVLKYCNHRMMVRYRDRVVPVFTFPKWGLNTEAARGDLG